MAAPVVQTLAQVMAELNPAYAGQESVIQQKQAGLGAKYGAQKTALTAEKGQGFNAINNQATGRGASFSGVPLDEQATYLSTKYLPGMQKADSDMNEEDLALTGELAKIGTEKSTAAQSRIDKQTSELNQWNLQQAQLEAQARENALSRSASASEAAKGRAASAPKAVNPTTAAYSIISSSLGRDGFVSPGAFQLARDAYKMAGGNVSNFATEFWKYTGTGKGQTNANNWKSYYYG